MKLAVLGGSAQSTPTLFLYLAHVPVPPELEVVLVGRNASKLAEVARVARLLLGKSPISVEWRTMNELSAALDGVDVVLFQVRFGGYEARRFDELFPLKYGVCGDEGLGPGGLSAAWRSWPEVQRLLLEVKERAPKAVVLMLSAPLGILVRAGRDLWRESKLMGICELPWTTLLSICSAMKVQPPEICFSYCGVNHVGWFYRIAVVARDLIEQYARLRDRKGGFPSGDLIRRCDGIPTKYLRLHYEMLGVIEEQRSRSKTRAEELEELSLATFAAFHTGSCGDIEAVLARRPAPWYTHAVGPALLGLAGREVSEPFFLSVENNGEFSEFSNEDILEIPHIFESGRLKRTASRGFIPRHVMDVTSAFVKYERAATTAVTHRDPLMLRAALRAHPWVNESVNIDAMAQEILASTARLEP